MQSPLHRERRPTTFTLQTMLRCLNTVFELCAGWVPQTYTHATLSPIKRWQFLIGRECVRPKISEPFRKYQNNPNDEDTFFFAANPTHLNTSACCNSSDGVWIKKRSDACGVAGFPVYCWPPHDVVHIRASDSWAPHCRLSSVYASMSRTLRSATYRLCG